MAPKTPHPAQFQFVVNARVKKGTRPSTKEVRPIVESWIEGTQANSAHPEWKISCIIWNGSIKRTITEFDESTPANFARSQVLRSILRRGLQKATFRVNTLGGTRI